MGAVCMALLWLPSAFCRALLRTSGENRSRLHGVCCGCLQLLRGNAQDIVVEAVQDA
jgi:hypothetical protein